MQAMSAVIDYLQKVGGDGHSILRPQYLVDMGFSKEFVKAKTYKMESGEGYKETIFDNNGKKIKSCVGVYALDFIGFIAKDIGADTSIADTKIGRGFRAQELALACHKRIEELKTQTKTIEAKV